MKSMQQGGYFYLFSIILYCEIDQENFATNLKGEVFPAKLSPDDPPPFLYIHKMLDTIGKLVVSA